MDYKLQKQPKWNHTKNINKVSMITMDQLAWLARVLSAIDKANTSLLGYLDSGTAVHNIIDLLDISKSFISVKST